MSEFMNGWGSKSDGLIRRGVVADIHVDRTLSASHHGIHVAVVAKNVMYLCGFDGSLRQSVNY
jgi:hypothetical protein